MNKGPDKESQNVPDIDSDSDSDSDADTDSDEEIEPLALGDLLSDEGAEGQPSGDGGPLLDPFGPGALDDGLQHLLDAGDQDTE